MSPEVTNFVRGMEKAGRLAADTLTHISKMVRPGVVTTELDREAEDVIRTRGGLPATLRYHGFTKSICLSLK